MIKIGSCERKWLNSHFPGIAVISPREMRGELSFCASLVNRETRCIQIYYELSDENVRQARGFIQDQFWVHIRFSDNHVPLIWEIGGRLDARYEELKSKEVVKGIADMHVYPKDKNVCLAHKCYLANTIREHPGVKEFFHRFLIPYFYFHGYWEKHGEQPWEGLSHDLGLATLEQVFCDRDKPERLNAYVQFIREQLDQKENFLSRFAEDATPNAKKGMVILRKHLIRRVLPATAS